MCGCRDWLDEIWTIGNRSESRDCRERTTVSCKVDDE